MSSCDVPAGTRLASRGQVPALSHELFVELFRSRAELACDLLRACAGIELAGTTTELASIDLSQITPTEYRADVVVLRRDEQSAPTAAVIVEVQTRVDADKHRTWPLYVAALRAIHACPVILLVFTPAESVARWARQPIELGHPGFCLHPIVVGLPDVPRILDPTAAPELVILSAIAHADLATAERALAAAASLPDDAMRLYSDLILTAVPELAQILEAKMKGYEYQSEFARKYYGQGLQEGHQEGLKEGHQEGLKEGHEEGVRDGLHAALVELVRSKLEGASPSYEDRIRSCSDVAVLTALVVELGQARDAGEARASLDTHLPG
jgi:hypothetical protein